MRASACPSAQMKALVMIISEGTRPGASSGSPMTPATPNMAMAVPVAFRASSSSFRIAHPSNTAKGIWICRMRLAAVAGIASLFRPQNSSAPWIVTAKAEMTMMDRSGVFSFWRCVRPSTRAMPP